MNINKEQYEKDLAEIKKNHLANVTGNKDVNWRPCLHDQCSECHGTGIKLDGSPCIHYISCSCPKCSPTY